MFSSAIWLIIYSFDIVCLRDKLDFDHTPFPFPHLQLPRHCNCCESYQPSSWVSPTHAVLSWHHLLCSQKLLLCLAESKIHRSQWRFKSQESGTTMKVGIRNVRVFIVSSIYPQYQELLICKSHINLNLNLCNLTSSLPFKQATIKFCFPG